VDGLHCLGADDATTAAAPQSSTDKALSFIQTAGPGLVSAVQTVTKGDKKTDTKTPGGDKSAKGDSGGGGGGGGGGHGHGGGGGSWFSEPALGPLPGGAVLGIGLALASALGFGIYKIVK